MNNRKILGRLLNYDIKKYKILHDIILGDTGNPSLDKQEFVIPDPEVIEQKITVIENDGSIDDDEDNLPALRKDVKREVESRLDAET